VEVLEPIVIFTAFFMSIVAHEVAHGWIALHLGDPTAMAKGRLTFNPIKHIDPFMTILLPIITYFSFGFPFGGAKPVPINPYNMKRMDRDLMLTAIAGPLTNIMLAAVFTIPMIVMVYQGRHISSEGAMTAGFSILYTVTAMNLFLALFNMIPIPPLDGSRLLRFFLPEGMRADYDRLERFGIMIVIMVLMFARRPINDFMITAIKWYFRMVLPDLESGS
jgi:Zn-dependent protease